IEPFPALDPGRDGDAHSIGAEVLDNILKGLEVLLPEPRKGRIADCIGMRSSRRLELLCINSY
ncbi:MAG: hypothetical protein ACLFMR_09430, partial [Desulfohalobiaceae bacterium]